MAHYHMRRSVISAGRPEITWKAGRLEVICEWLKLFDLASKLAGIKAGRGYEKYMRDIPLKSLSSYAVKSAIHAIGVKNIPVFPIHEVRIERGGNGENRNL